MLVIFVSVQFFIPTIHASLNMCKSVNFKYPSYSETVNKVNFYDGRRDCCYDPKCFQTFEVGTIAPKIKLKDLQKEKLGVPKLSNRFFSTNARAYNKEEPKKAESDFQKPLPCLKKSDDIISHKKEIKSKLECKKLCMPCCKPARDPPDCFFPYIKPECKRKRASRPAFSECQADRSKVPEPCECSYIILPRCALTTASDKKEKCDKKKK
uniref:Secreted protein n=1 Tax=Triatoma infestans TaxID=30076 RepID=A0A161MML4_TRIIF